MAQARSAGRRARPGPGRLGADDPTDIPAAGWKAIALRTKEQVRSDAVSTLAGGVAFFSVLAIFPAMIATLSIYGLVSDPADVARQVEELSAGLPDEVRRLLVAQLEAVASTSSSSLTVGLVVSVLAAFWAASKGMKALIEAINVAYDEDETRGFVELRVLAYGFTVGGVLLVVATVFAITALPALGEDLGPAGRAMAGFVRWPVLAGVMLLGLAVIYRFAPARSNARWQWVTPGSLTAGLLWVLGSVVFAVYVNNFGNYDETYGSIGAVVVLMLWLYLTAFVVLLGAELNGEAERQSAPEAVRRAARQAAAEAIRGPGEA
ncbi:MAG TPA: YihY/virulence factor BrkB family protein [Acidimicrobiales bacterium]|nr:YihY/virulence factor BrkB family protein [Acidimicrobiales bacterium]